MVVIWRRRKPWPIHGPNGKLRPGFPQRVACTPPPAPRDPDVVDVSRPGSGLPPSRLLRYMVRLWEGWLAEHPGAKHLPAIVPVVLHHGSRAWSAPRSLHELVNLSPEALAAIADVVPSYRYLLDDLAVQPVEALVRRARRALLG
jgi:hypothetical protein